MILGEQPVEGTSTDAERLCRVNFVAFSAAHDLLHVSALDGAKMVWIAALLSGFGNAFGDAFGQVIQGDQVVFGEDLRSLQYICKLADVSRPFVVDQGIQRLGSQPRTGLANLPGRQ